METPQLFDLSNRRQLYDLIYHQESVKNGLPLEINDISEELVNLNVDKFRQAYGLVFKRHEGLRTVFRRIGNEIKQEIYPYSSDRFNLPVYDLSGLSPELLEQRLAELKSDLKADFNDLRRAIPLAQGALFRISHAAHVFVFYCHHILADAYSMKIFSNDLFTIYDDILNDREISLAEINVTCREFLRQRHDFSKGNYEEKLYSYWTKKLQEYLIPVERQKLYHTFNIPKDNSNLQEARKNFDNAKWFVYTTAFESKQPVAGLSGTLGVTPQIVLMASFFICAHLCYGTDKIIAISPVPGRNNKESRQIIGNLFGNIFLKSVISPVMPLKDVMMKIYMDFLQSCRYPIFDFERFDPFDVREKCEFFVNYLDVNDRKDIKVSAPDNYRHIADKEYYSLSYIVNEYKNGFTFRWIYQDDIYTKEVIECLAKTHELFLREFINAPDSSLAELSALLRHKYQVH